ncbi:MAG: hypothetical protein K6G65_10300 [Lachnospiraceae bacterium]|nr:hypothetical protein [Lachnospiraceae bacterium]
MKKFLFMVVAVLCFAGTFTISDAKTLKLSKNYTRNYKYEYLTMYDMPEQPYDNKIKIKEPGMYDITIEYLDIKPGEKVEKKNTCLKYSVHDKTDTKYFKVPIYTKRKSTVGLEKGTAIISVYPQISENDYTIKYKIKICKSDKQNLSFSKAVRFAKKKVKSSMKYTKKGNTASITGAKIQLKSDPKVEKNNQTAIATPVIQIKKTGKRSYANLLFKGRFDLYSQGGGRGITVVSLYNAREFDEKIHMDFCKFDETKGTCKYDEETGLYKEKVSYHCPVFKSYKNTVKKVDKMISVLKSKKAYFKLRNSGGEEIYGELDKKTKKKWLDIVKLYRELLEEYNEA